MPENTEAVTAAPAEVWYRGDSTSTAGPHAVIIETGGHEPLGMLVHVPRHSPTGMSWGYGGSGPADLARSLLIAVLGDGARCPTCNGSLKVIWNPVTQREEPYVPGSGPERGYGQEPYHCGDCEDGYRRLPYQAFKFEVVAKWGDSWRMSRTEILAWLAAHGDI